MKSITKILSLTLIAFVAMSFTPEKGERTSYKLDKEGTSVKWHAEKVTGEHSGTVKIANGTLDFEGDQLVGGMIEIDMTSIKNTDMEGEMAQKLEGHLKSEDFFNVAEYPKATFKVKEVFPRGPKGSFKVIGDLTIKGITKEYKFNTDLKSNESMTKGYAEIAIDRTDFDVKYGSSTFFGSLGDKTIYDDFVLKIDLSATK